MGRDALRGESTTCTTLRPPRSLLPEGPVVVLAEWEKHEAAAALAVGGNRLEVLTHRGAPTSTVFLDRQAEGVGGFGMVQ